MNNTNQASATNPVTRNLMPQNANTGFVNPSSTWKMDESFFNPRG